MEFGTSGEDSPELGQQPINSRSKYDAYRRSHDGTRTTHEGNTNMLIFIVVYTGMTDEGDTEATRRLHDVVLRVRCVRNRSRRRHVTYRCFQCSRYCNGNKTIFTCKRRYWAGKRCSSFSLKCVKRSNAAAFFFLVVSSSKYAILQELNCDWSFGSYTRLRCVELLRTDWTYEYKPYRVASARSDWLEQSAYSGTNPGADPGGAGGPPPPPFWDSKQKKRKGKERKGKKGEKRKKKGKKRGKH